VQEEQKNSEALKVQKKQPPQHFDNLTESFENLGDLTTKEKIGSNLKLKISDSKSDFPPTSAKKKGITGKKIMKTEESDNEEFDRNKIKEALESLKFENFTSILTNSSPLAKVQPLTLIKNSSTSSKFSSSSNSDSLRIKLPNIN
jgi:Tfp pilus assembly protein PilV